MVDGGSEAPYYRIFLELIWLLGLDHSMESSTVLVNSPRTSIGLGTENLGLNQGLTNDGARMNFIAGWGKT